jgi:hypothetical protein
MILTAGWLRSCGCSAVHAISSILGGVVAHHVDLDFFARYIAPYRSSIDESDIERTWLIIYGNPLTPWNITTDYIVRGLSTVGYNGIMLRIGADSEQTDLDRIRVISIPRNIDPLLVYHIATIKTILEIADRENPSPRVARLVGEISDLGSIVSSILQRYEAKLRDIAEKISMKNITFITTCISRAFAEGLILDGFRSIKVYDITDLYSTEILEKTVAVLYIEAEKDLVPHSLISKNAIDLVLKTDPIPSPIYYRILSISILNMLKRQRMEKKS